MEGEKEGEGRLCEAAAGTEQEWAVLTPYTTPFTCCAPADAIRIGHFQWCPPGVGVIIGWQVGSVELQ